MQTSVRGLLPDKAEGVEDPIPIKVASMGEVPACWSFWMGGDYP